MTHASSGGTAERSRTGIAGLDEVLGGGFIPDRLYLVDGDPGSGKTTLALQYLMEGAGAARRSSTSPCPKPGKS